MVPAAWRGEMTVRGLYGAGLLGYAFFCQAQRRVWVLRMQYLSHGLCPLAKLVGLLP